MKNRLFSNIVEYLSLIRISHWLKNVFVFVPLVYSKNFFNPELFTKTLVAFFVFSIASSLVYVFNDYFDAEKDRFHPLKKNRPIARGAISKENAVIVSIILLISVIVLSFLIWNQFIVIVWIYILINILYTLYLKRIVIVDIFTIAAGFILRILGGAIIISVYISNWLLLTAVFLTLFLAVMKRRVEIATSSEAIEHRDVLKHYSLGFIDKIVSISAGGVILSYALYTVSEKTTIMFSSEKLVYTIPFVIFGVFRYIYLVYKENKGENITEVLISDIPMIINSVLYISITLVIIYF